jgi:hypothetical protein
LYDRLPTDLITHIKAVSKISSIAWVSPNYTYETTTDKIWVLGASEGTNEVLTNTKRPDDGVLYEYFSTPENRKKYIQRFDGVETEYATEYCLRSFGRAEGTNYAVFSIQNADGKLGRGGFQEYALGFCI